jgi:hypothetical protein
VNDLAAAQDVDAVGDEQGQGQVLLDLPGEGPRRAGERPASLLSDRQ